MILQCPDHLISTSKAVALQNDEVHVWIAHLDEPCHDKLFDALSCVEQARADRFHFERDRRRFRLGRLRLRQILARYLVRPPGHLRFRYGRWGKPELDSPFSRSGLRFNLSHSNEIALYAVTRHRKVGIDIERVRPIEVEQLARRFFSRLESQALCALGYESKNSAFLRCWTGKEAFLKALGDGMHRALDSFAVSVSPRGPGRLLYDRDDPQGAARWSLFGLNGIPGYVASIATQGRVSRVVRRRYE